MASLLDKYTLSLEEQILAEAAEITPEESEQLAEDHATLREDQEQLTADIVETADDINTAETAVDNLEQQNEIIEAAVASGQMNGAVAAQSEVARRLAVAPLGLDTETTETVVDSEALESMAFGGALALEQNQQVIVALEGAISDVFKIFLSKINEVITRIEKATNIIAKRYKEAYAVVKSVSDEEFAAKVEKLTAKSDIAKYLDNGKPVDLEKVIKSTQPYHGYVYEVEKALKKQFKYINEFSIGGMAINAVNALLREKGVTKYVHDRVQEENKAFANKLASVSFGAITYKSTMKDGAINFSRDVSKEHSSPSFTRKEFLDAINVGLIQNWNKSIIHDTLTQVSKIVEEMVATTDTYGTQMFGDFITSLRSLATSVAQMANDVEAMASTYVNFALSFKK